jgi:Zn-dependent M28 family amino/carboxypeptidase
VSASPDGEQKEFPRESLRTLANSGSGEVEAQLQSIDLGPPPGSPGSSSSGCEREDFSGFESGQVALVRRGACSFQTKVENAVAAGAAGLIIMNDGAEGRSGLFSGRLGAPAPIPVVGITAEAGRALAAAALQSEGTRVRLALDVQTGTRSTRNVIAEWGRAGTATVVVGAHLDSVPEGPGINDNGSGSAAVLETALRLAQERSAGMRIRFAFWSAEERGLIGSRHHVGSLSDEERRRIAIYVNLDMVGSVNFGRFLQGTPDSGDGIAYKARRALLAYFRDQGLPVEERSGGRRRGFGSDDSSFAEKEIPTLGLYSGAGETKSEAHAAQFGGTAERPFDPCYHKACDDLSNIDRGALERMSEALVQTLLRLASDAPNEPADGGSNSSKVPIPRR